MQAAYATRPIPGAVATLGVDARMAFIRRTYAHLAGAIALFVVLTGLVVNTIGESVAIWAFSGYNWFIVLGLFMAAGWAADKWAHSSTSRGMQYLGLGLYVLAEAFIFTPLLYVAAFYSDASVIPTAGVLTLAIFGALTATVFLTKKDFSFLRGAISVGMMAALGVIVMSMIFGFSLGILFAGAMILLAAGYVLYMTSQVLAHYPPTYHVGAALGLFAAIALMFYYILIFLMSLSRN